MAAAPKKVTKPKTVAKVKVTKSRGSNTAKQVGDMNQLEGARVKNSYNNGSKVSQADLTRRSKAAKKILASGGNALGTEMGLADAMKKRKKQRAGGKGI